MLNPAEDAGRRRTPCLTHPEDAQAARIGATRATPLVIENPPPLHGPLAHLPGSGAQRPACGYDPAELHRRLQGWIASANDRTPGDDLAGPMPTALAQQLGEDFRSACTAALAFGLAHSAEMLLVALSNHPLIRVCAVSHPYVLATLLERLLKGLAEIEDPDPHNRTGARFEEKLVVALATWNHLQPALDTVLKSPLARCLKVVATAALNGARDVAERAHTRALLRALPPDTPAGPRKLTDMESLFVNCLMCWLRNVGVDLIRQVVRSEGAQALPAAASVTEGLLRAIVLGPSVPGGLPAAAISAQAAFADALTDADDDSPAARAAAEAEWRFSLDSPF